MREFETGATRDDDDGKYDYEGFLCPLVMRAYGEYMHKHRIQADGKMRDSDNWQKGMSKKVYIKSLWRHFVALWTIWRGYEVKDEKDGHVVTLKEACCAIKFNTDGFLHELLKENA